MVGIDDCHRGHYMTNATMLSTLYASLASKNLERAPARYPQDILACLRLRLWDGALERMLRYAEARGT